MRKWRLNDSCHVKNSLNQFPISTFFSLTITLTSANNDNQPYIVKLEIIGDTEVEEDEDLWLNATVTATTIVDADGKAINKEDIKVNPGLGTILNDDSEEDEDEDDNNDDNSNTLKVEVSDGSRIEMNGEITFTVSLIGTLQDGETLTVNLETFDGSASEGYDYSSTSGSVTFDSTSSTQTFSVPIYDDPYKESDENFYVDTVGYSGYTGDKEVLLNNIGTGTILDDEDEDGQVVIEVSSTSAKEGDSGVQSAEVCVSISSVLSEDITIDISSGDSVTIAAGSTSTTAQVDICKIVNNISTCRLDLEQIREVA